MIWLGVIGTVVLLALLIEFGPVGDIESGARSLE